MGELWIHLPGVGKWFERAQKPLPMMLMAALAGFMIVAPRRAIKRLRRRVHRPPTQQRREQPRPSSNGSGGPAGILGPDGQTAMTVVGVVALASLMLALLAFSRSPERQATEFVNYQHTGEFSYSADASGAVYEGGSVETGQPVYLELVDSVDVRFSYQFGSDLPTDASGTYRIDAVVAYDEGLSRTIPLVPEMPFEDGAFETSATLALAEAWQYIDQVASQIGAQNSATGSHRISIVPTIAVTGAVGNQSIDETFAPSLDFELDEVAMRLPAAGATTPAADAGESGQASSPLQPVESGLIERPTIEPATLSVLMLDVRISTARQIVVAGLVLSGIAGAVLAWLYATAQRAAEPARIRARYSPLLIKVNGSDLGINGHDGHIVEVASIEDLARVAEREGRMILHQQQGGRHEYFVQDVDVTYSYTCSEGRRTAPQGIPETRPSA